jgi:hypothetical protein
MNSINTWSLEGEDIIAATILRNVSCGQYFDIGCADPVHISNTWKFYQQGWRGLAVDGRPIKNAWAEQRPEDVFIQQVLGDGADTVFYEFPDPHLSSCDTRTILRYSDRFPSESITCKSLPTVQASSLWNKVFPSSVPELVSLDVEGQELAVLKGFNLETERPKLFIIELKEFNFIRPLSHPLAAYLYDHQYILIAKTPLDGFFIDAGDQVFEWIPESMKQLNYP